jgi:hypothetical protein
MVSTFHTNHRLRFIAALALLASFSLPLISHTCVLAEELIRMYDRPCRFDVVVVDLSGERPRVEVYAGAFEAPF